MDIKYSVSWKALPPQPIRLKPPSWAGEPEKMQDGSVGQPWHCLPFVEGSTYGLELIYQFETECRVVNENGVARFQWDYPSEPGCKLTGGEFIFFAPLHAPKYYLFNTRVDLQPPPGYVIRTEPHPRFFTDETGTVPMAMIGHLQSEWYPRQQLVVFRVPPPGQCHVFRKGEPYAQVLMVPQRVSYTLTPMTPEEDASRRKLEREIQHARPEVATNRWQNVDGGEIDNHYKILAGAFAREGLGSVEEMVQAGLERRQTGLPTHESVAQCLERGAQFLDRQQYREAEMVYAHVLEREPQNAVALSQIGICLVCLGNIPTGLNLMTQAVNLQPHWPKGHSSLGEILRLLGRLPEAESCFRRSLQLNPSDGGVASVLGFTLAQQGRLTEGVQLCRSALTMNNPVAAVHFRLGVLLEQQGGLAEARSCYEAALALNPNFADAQRALRKLPVAG